MSDEEVITFSEDNNNNLFSSTENNDQHPISSSNKASTKHNLPTSTSIEPSTNSTTTKVNENELNSHKRKKLTRKRTENDIDQIVKLISNDPSTRSTAITKEKTDKNGKTNNTNTSDTTSPRNEQAKKINEYRLLMDKFTILFGDDHLRTNEIKHILAARLYKAEQFDESLKLFIKLKDFYENHENNEENKDKTLLNIVEKCILCRIKLNNISGDVTNEIVEICIHRYKTIYQCDDTEIWKKHTKQLIENLIEHGYYLEAERVLSELLNEADRLLLVNKVGEDEDAFMEMMREMKMMLAHCYKHLEQYQKSLDMYLDVYSLIQDDEYVLPNPREDMLSLKELMADLYCKVKDFEKALGMYFELYSDYIEQHGGECTETLSIRTSIAEVFLRQEKIEDSLKIYMAVFESYLNLPDTKKGIKIHMKHIIGHVYLKEEKLFEALQTFRDVLHEYTLLYHKTDGRHSDILEAKSSVACALLKEKKFEESKTLYKQVRCTFHI